MNTWRLLKLGTLLALSKLSSLKSIHLPQSEVQTVTKISASSQTSLLSLKGHHLPCSPPPWSLQSGTVAATAFPPPEAPPLPTHVRGNESMQSFKQVSNLFSKFGLFLPLQYNPLRCFLPAPWCLFLHHYSSHKALSQMMGSSAGASKGKGRSETVIALLEPKAAEQEIPQSNSSNRFPRVEKQHFTGCYSSNRLLSWTDSGCINGSIQKSSSKTIFSLPSFLDLKPKECLNPLPGHISCSALPICKLFPHSKQELIGNGLPWMISKYFFRKQIL